MKIDVSVEATAQEMREFFGLPNVRPLQDEILKAVQENMRKGVAGFDALSLMKPLLPVQLQSMEMLQRAFWDAFVKAGDAAREVGRENSAPAAPQN